MGSQLIEEQAWSALEKSIIYFRGQPIGTIAALDPEIAALNYDQCFIRDFISSALLFLIKGRPEIVRNFLEATLTLQPKTGQLDCSKPSRGLMPASFKIQSFNGQEYLKADFGDHAIGRVAPADACLWWVILLRAYTLSTQDTDLVEREDFQEGIRLVLELCLVTRFDMYPMVLVPDAASMIDRRMGLYGHPLDIQSLFFAALKASLEMLVPNETNQFMIRAVENRLIPLTKQIRENYWLDPDRLNVIYRFQVEEYGEEALNQFNIYSDSIPFYRLANWLPEAGGYLAGNLGPSQLDCRFFSLGNLMAIIVSLTDEQQSHKILNLIELRWNDLVGHMPMKLCYPALEDSDWRIVTGADPKNRPWSYHNGGSWPVLLWMLTAAAKKMDRGELAHHAIAVAERRLMEDHWPEYYDGPDGRLIGKEARTCQTWTITGYLLAKELLANPDHLKLITFAEEQ
ncbi:alkaline invertase [Phormidesmis priestleyi ULC007]|uniref:beta-fructofuranosidase n=1 Tax=Phormidesmis priestleyi ULC007 TaxID=1920490 RepID=A0A2T1D9J9_9CYAN|nr:glycoside hydrolase 100 family protein [Phormidesmis priestleyi]PSB17113.1 alkaline invertase [Phormidesmis priestleyi ULC007]PZO47479.1 MAG: alkaline invertase [Phormidesmis priestleyi]